MGGKQLQYETSCLSHDLKIKLKLSLFTSCIRTRKKKPQIVNIGGWDLAVCHRDDTWSFFVILHR